MNILAYDTNNPEQQSRQVQKTLLSWYRAEVKTVVAERMQVWSQRTGLTPKGWRITSALHQWGSCSAENHICINWQVICLPMELLDYIVVHELCHLVHKNHSSLFWDLVEKWLPDYRSRRKAIKKQSMFFS